MNGKQAKRLRKAALGLGAVIAESGQKVTEADVKIMYKSMKKGKTDAADLPGPKHRAPTPL